MTPGEIVARTYGNWRRPRSPGIYGLGTLGTALLIATAASTVIVTLLAGLRAAGVVLLAGLTVVALLRIRDRHHTTALQRVAIRAAWLRARATGAHLYRSGPLWRPGEGTFRLQGLMASSALREAVDAQGHRFAIVHVPAKRHYTVVFGTDPDGSALVDEDQIDLWVAGWGQWLAQLADEPGVIAASVTVETAPDSGMRLRREVENHIAANAPELARAMLGEVVATYPAGSATVRAYVAVTFKAKGGMRDIEEVGRDLAQRVPGLAQTLRATGAGAARPLSAQRLCEVVRTAYDPTSADVLEHARVDGTPATLTWGDVGPAGAQAEWDRYRHDAAWSVTWSMTDAPRGEVHARVLERLLAPHPDVDRKRVTLVYRPIGRAKTARIVERDQRDVQFLVGAEQRPSQRLLIEHAQAQQNAIDEARGAGLVNFGLLVTATVLDHERLPAAKHAVDHLAATARVQLRPMFGAQDSAFAAGLPLGLVLPAHLRVPADVREAL